jgi:uncharacterized protein YbjT (DUF2867 family)
VKVAIAGGHGKVAQQLERLLSADNHEAIGLIRDPDQAGDLRELGAEPVVCDLEAAGDEEVAAAVAGSDAVVFAAGAGPGSGAERKRTMDLGGAVKLIDAAKSEGISRYLIVSSMGAGDPPPDGEGDVFGEYLRAKAAADEAVMQSGLDYTVVRPGSLTDDEPSGRVEVGPKVERGEVSRADVAAVLYACLRLDTTVGKAFEMVAGEIAIDEALAAL